MAEILQNRKLKHLSCCDMTKSLQSTDLKMGAMLRPCQDIAEIFQKQGLLFKLPCRDMAENLRKRGFKRCHVAT